jgi:hypothetical protein
MPLFTEMKILIKSFQGKILMTEGGSWADLDKGHTLPYQSFQKKYPVIPISYPEKVW